MMLLGRYLMAEYLDPLGNIDTAICKVCLAGLGAWSSPNKPKTKLHQFLIRPSSQSVKRLGKPRG